jgi:Holliday junction resolvase-like predicted endonuclease
MRRRKLRKLLRAGQRGAQPAYFYLRKESSILSAQYLPFPRRQREIDLIGWDGDMLCVIEVKTRRTVRWVVSYALESGSGTLPGSSESLSGSPG